MTRSAALAVFLAGVLCGANAESSRLAPSSATRQSNVSDGNAALARKDWAGAIEAFAAAERSGGDLAATIRGLGAAHAGAGHELAAIAWYRAWLQMTPPGAAEREQVLDDIVRLEIRAEARIRRIAQEASDALDDIGEGDAGRTAKLRKVVIETALARDDMTTARDTVRLIAADIGGRDALWAGAALALAGDDDFERAIVAAKEVTNASKRKELVQTLESRRATATQVPPATQWRMLARDLSQRSEIVGLDAELQDIARGPAAEVPLRLLAIGSKLQSAFARIQRLKQLR